MHCRGSSTDEELGKAKAMQGLNGHNSRAMRCTGQKRDESKMKLSEGRRSWLFVAVAAATPAVKHVFAASGRCSE